MASVFLFVFFLLSHLPLLHSTEEEMRYTESCPPFACGYLPSIPFPFAYTSHPECGLFPVECSDGNTPLIRLQDGKPYQILDIFLNNNTIRLLDFKLWEHLKVGRCETVTNITLPSVAFFPFEIIPNHNQSLLFKCNSSLSDSTTHSDFKSLPCDLSNTHIFYGASNKGIPGAFAGCLTLQLPWSLDQDAHLQSHFGDPDFPVTPYIDLKVKVSRECYECYEKGGQCRARDNVKFYCKKELTRKQKIGIGTSIVGFGVGFLLLVIFCFRRKLLFDDNIYCWKKKSLTHQTIQTFLRDHGHLAIKQYNYSDIKKITYSFKDKLGEGAYGSVYKGKLQDGCLVAVKVLKELKGNGEEFINEVASISRTSHVNIVSLMGFCFEHSKRALIYEFMPNGSLEKFIYKTNSSKDVHQLEWEAIYKIAIGIAQGLEYLHKGCNIRILHFDIKPHNILLDENFSPKISDFGLAKVCCREQSIVSMLGARGTIGYIALEVFYRSIGGISHKSDVYSYGMLVLEMIGRRRNIEVDVDHTSEIFFPHWIHKRIGQDQHLGLQNLTNEHDQESARKMVIVGLWCIQTNPSNRPSMGRVVNMLEGLEPLQVPPKPVLSSPSRSPSRLPKNSSTTMETL